MVAVTLVAASLCLQGGERVDLSQYVASAATMLEVKVTFSPASGKLVVYSPGYEHQQARFSGDESSGWIRFPGPILCVKAIGGPFEFNMQIVPVEID
jgi:hypothetical protein